MKRGERLKNITIPFVAERSRWGILPLILVFLVIVYLTLGFDAVWEIDGSRDELMALKFRVEVLRSERDSLLNVLSRLENDMDYVEKVAREDFGMSRKLERVYPLPQSSED